MTITKNKILMLIPVWWRSRTFTFLWQDGKVLVHALKCVLCLSGERTQRNNERVSNVLRLFSVPGIDMMDGWLPAAAQMTQRVCLCCLCLIRALMATRDPIWACFFCFFFLMETDITWFVFGLETVSWPSTALIPSGSGRSRRHGAWRSAFEWPPLSTLWSLWQRGAGENKTSSEES